MINRGELKDIITDVAPIEEPNMVDVQDFRKAVANVLSTNKSRTEITGHAWLIETEAGHKKCTGDDIAALLRYPHMYNSTATMTSIKQLLLRRDVKLSSMTVGWNKAHGPTTARKVSTYGMHQNTTALLH